jgi:hypothetical protein
MQAVKLYYDLSHKGNVNIASPLELNGESYRVAAANKKLRQRGGT